MIELSFSFWLVVDIIWDKIDTISFIYCKCNFAKNKREPHAGFEPATFRLLSERSTNWANAACYIPLRVFWLSTAHFRLVIGKTCLVQPIVKKLIIGTQWLQKSLVFLIEPQYNISNFFRTLLKFGPYISASNTF